MKSKLLVATLAVLSVSVVAMSDAQSAPASFSFTIDGNPDGNGVSGPHGSVLVLATKNVDPTLVGRTCSVTLDVHNNDSVRQGTDLLISSAGVSLTALNVEATRGDAPPVVIGDLVLGSTVTGAVRFGAADDGNNDGLGSASVAATIRVSCPDLPTTPTVSPDTVTRAPRPEVQVEAEVVVVSPSFTG
jgi:hypothetical protein